MKSNKELNNELFEDNSIFENAIIDNVKIQDLVPINIDGFIVSIINNHHTIIIPKNVDGIQLKTWYMKRGGIFAKDLLNFLKNKSHGQYVIIKTKDTKIIVRLIEEKEIQRFKILNLIDGKIKDKCYMILKEIGKEKNRQLYINENDFDFETIENIFQNQHNTHNFDNDYNQDDYYTTSISLF